MGRRYPLNVVRAIVARIQAAGTVDFSTRDGVRCPICGSTLTPGKLGVARVMGWSGSCRERYHRCPECGANFKSVETVNASF